MATKIEVANMALALVGSRSIVSLSESSVEANSLNTHIDVVRDEVLRDFPWPRSTKQVALGLIETDPTTEWAYSYREPSDCVFPQRLVTGLGLSENQSDRIRFLLNGDADGGLILTNQKEAILQYTWRNKNYEHYPVDQIRANAAKLAFYIAPRLTNGDPYNLQQRAANVYMEAIGNAAANAFNEERSESEAVAAPIAARDC